MVTNRTIFQRFLNEHPDGKNKAFDFESCYPEIECVIEWYEDKKETFNKDDLRHFNFLCKSVYCFGKLSLKEKNEWLKPLWEKVKGNLK